VELQEIKLKYWGVGRTVLKERAQPRQKLPGSGREKTAGEEHLGPKSGRSSGRSGNESLAAMGNAGEIVVRKMDKRKKDIFDARRALLRGETS